MFPKSSEHSASHLAAAISMHWREPAGSSSGRPLSIPSQAATSVSTTSSPSLVTRSIEIPSSGDQALSKTSYLRRSTNTAAASIARSCNLLVVIAPFRFRVGPSAQRLVARGTQGIRHRAREKAKSTWKAIAEASFRKVFQPLIQTSWRRVFEKCRGLCAGGGLSALLT